MRNLYLSVMKRFTYTKVPGKTFLFVLVIVARMVIVEVRGSTLLFAKSTKPLSLIFSLALGTVIKVCALLVFLYLLKSLTSVFEGEK